MVADEVAELLRKCAAVACQKVEAAGLVPYVDWRWFHQGSVYIKIMTPICERSSSSFREIGCTIRISDHPPRASTDASWSIHPGADTDIDQLVARARRHHQSWQNEVRSRSARYKERFDRDTRKMFKRGRR